MSCRFMALRKCAINACINYCQQLNGSGYTDRLKEIGVALLRYKDTQILHIRRMGVGVDIACLGRVIYFLENRLQLLSGTMSD